MKGADRSKEKFEWELRLLGGARNFSLTKITACPGQSRSDVWCHLVVFLGLSCSPKSSLDDGEKCVGVEHAQHFVG